MPAWSRRRIETILLAALAIGSVIPLRFSVESRGWFIAETASLLLALSLVETMRAIGDRWRYSKHMVLAATAFLATSPVLYAVAARWFGSPIAFEMSALTTFGAISLALAVVATSNRTQSLSIVVSGFLVLFTASISDEQHAIVLPLVWMLGCVWHLVANRWERLDLALPESVQRTWSLRPVTLLGALLVLAGGGLAIKDRMTEPNRLTFGWMPSSGGNRWSDPAARKGVGTGDAAIAAKQHAESFGAVDSDIFLESTESSLFDMVNDMIGEPKKAVWERRQAMGNDKVIPMHEKAAKSERGGGSFSTDRMPPKQHHHFHDASDTSVIQWDGPTGIRLAMHRYDSFDGVEWRQSADSMSGTLARVEHDTATWFFDPFLRMALLRDPDATSFGRVKVLRLQSQRLPAPMLTAGVHVKDVDRSDFFGVSEDGSFFMPGRERVPPLTVVHVASLKLTEDEIQASLTTIPAIRPSDASATAVESEGNAVQASPPELAPTVAPSLQTGSAKVDQWIAACVEDWTVEGQTPYDQLRSMLDRLRTEFTFDRESSTAATSLEEFLTSRRGGDHLFATTAALMASQLGLKARLVTGFYVRPNSRDLAAGHACVMPRDVHVWAEVKLNDGRWFEIEPTPGYLPPIYRASWRLRIRRFVAAAWPALTCATMALTGLYLSRCWWIDRFLTILWALTGWLGTRRRMRLAMQIIELRARLAGQRRPAGRSQRAWLEQLTRADATISSAARQFTDAADVLFFGQGETAPNRDSIGLVELLRVRTIHTLAKKATT